MGTTFLSMLTEPDRAALLRSARRRTVEPDSTVFHEGDEPTSFAVILEGRVKIVGRSDNGRQVLIGLAAGDIVGEMGAIDGRPRSVDVVAADTVHMLVGTARVLRDFLQHHPSGWTAVCVSLSSRLRESDRDRILTSALPGTARVAARLTTLAARYGGARDETSVELPISQDELADWTGLSLPTVARALAELRRAGLVHTSRRRIVIADTQRLAVHQMT